MKILVNGLEIDCSGRNEVYLIATVEDATWLAGAIESHLRVIEEEKDRNPT